MTNLFILMILNFTLTISETDLQRALAGGGQGQRQVHKGLKRPWLAMAGLTLNGGLELSLEQRDDNGLVQQFVFAPGQVSCHLIIQMVVLLLLVPLPVVRLTTETGKTTWRHDKDNRDFRLVTLLILLIIPLIIIIAVKETRELQTKFLTDSYFFCI